MPRAALNVLSSATSTANRVTFHDGLGKRLHVRHPNRPEALEVLQFNPRLTAVPSFEFAVRERMSRLGYFNEACFAHVRGVGRKGDDGPLLLVSDYVAGSRLSQMLVTVERRRLRCELETALCLIRQLVSAVALLHERAPGIAHGAIGPERIVVTPGGDVVLVEHVLGGGLEQLQCSADRYWQELGIALPLRPGAPTLDRHADITQVGVVALALLLGRSLKASEYPSHVPHLCATVCEEGAAGPLPSSLRLWLARALQLDRAGAFRSGLDAWQALEALLSQGELVIPSTSESFVRLCEAQSGHPVATDDPEAAQSPALSLPPAAQPALSIAVSPRSTNLVATESSTRGSSITSLRLSDPTLVLDCQAIAVVDQPHAIALPPAHRVRVRLPKRWGFQMAASAGIVACAGIGIFGWQRYRDAGEPRTGTVTFETTPPGAAAIVDGTLRGVTPLTLTLGAGWHNVELRRGRQSRSLPITVRAGEQLSQAIELPKAATQWGQLEVRTEPAGAQVRVDGVSLGTSPVRIDLAAGDHSVELRGRVAGLTQQVTIRPAITTSLVVPLPLTTAAAQTYGWIAIASPVEVQAFEHGQLLGSSQSRRIMVVAGMHDLEIANEVLGYRASRTVKVKPGEVTDVKVEFPNGTVTLNTIPSAEVWIDGTRVGQTPVNNLSVPLGPHEILFRNPEVGERRHAVTVTLPDPIKLNIDLTKR